MNAPAELANHLRHLPIEDLITSRSHVQSARRLRYADQGLDELAASIRQSGVLQPILVRPFNEPHLVRASDGASPSFEIIAGERRYLASQRAGFKEIPAIVRELNDTEVLEAQLVENLQRQDLDALSEAEGYQELMEVAKLNADEIAAKVGKSRAYVYSRIKLLDLSDDGRAALATGKLDASRALLVARLKDPKRQAKALSLALEMSCRGDAPMHSYRSLVEQIGRKKATIPLSQATFPLADASFEPGPCTTCEFRSGNCGIEGIDEDPNVCNDVRCFNLKTREASARRVRVAKTVDRPIIQGDEAKKIIDTAAYLYNARNFAGYIDLDARCDYERPDIPQPEETGNEEADQAALGEWERQCDEYVHRTYREILGEEAVPTVVLIDPKTKRALELLPVDIARRALDRLNINLGVEVGKVAGAAHKPHDNKEWERKEAERVARVQRAHAYRLKLAQAVFPKAVGPLDPTELALIAKELADNWVWRELVGKFYGGKPQPGSMTADELGRFIRFTLLSPELRPHDREPSPMLDALAKRHKIDAAAIKAEIEGKPKIATKKAPGKKAATKKALATKKPAKKAKSK